MQMINVTDLIELDRRAVAASLTALDGCAPTEMTGPTPCGEWTLAELIAHTTVQQNGFARAAAGARSSVADWAPTTSTDPLGDYAAACERVLIAFGALTDPGAALHLPEILDQPVPAEQAVSFHLVDNVVHAWDVAASRGRPVTLDDDVLEAARSIARLVPDGAERDQPGAAFATGRPVPIGASALDETLLRLGRDPRWPARA